MRSLSPGTIPAVQLFASIIITPGEATGQRDLRLPVQYEQPGSQGLWLSQEEVWTKESGKVHPH